MYNLKSLYIQKAKGKIIKDTALGAITESKVAERVGSSWEPRTGSLQQTRPGPARPGSEVAAARLVPSGPSSAVADSSRLQFLPPPSQTSPLPPQK